MATSPLIPNQIQVIMQQITMGALGVTDPSLVRIGWQSRGQPAQAITQDVAYLRCVEQDDSYDRIRDHRTLENTSTTVTEEFRYTRVWKTFWCVYGPDSFDNVRKIRSALLTDSGTHDLLAAANLYLITDTRSPDRAPDLFVGQRWERVDFDAEFNELVVESSTVNSVASLEVIGETPRGIVFDEVILTAPPPGIIPPPQYEPPYPVYLSSLPVPAFRNPLHQPDGGTTIFVFPFPALNTVQIFLGGLLQSPNGDYSLVVVGLQTIVTFASAPMSGSSLVAYF